MAMALANRMRYKKETALYNATHEPETQLANTQLLETKIKERLYCNDDFAVCIIKITDFSSLLPYISNSDNNDLMLMVSQMIEEKLHHEYNFLVL
jgi:GGDEF domain-containing protein